MGEKREHHKAEVERKANCMKMNSVFKKNCIYGGFLVTFNLLKAFSDYLRVTRGESRWKCSLLWDFREETVCAHISPSVEHMQRVLDVNIILTNTGETSFTASPTGRTPKQTLNQQAKLKPWNTRVLSKPFPKPLLYTHHLLKHQT